ncbi:MAG TPA: GNAT family N-acetyltransferase [Solirubrobacterales bacterium]|jgi:ribosomal protein S18 acetylase RimI-like enzyme|nr:GNAT family N-acetyltransferase [Solirubrobacterales bacterium]
MSCSYRIAELTSAEVERVAPLFKQLVDFHREVVEGAWPVRSVEEAWAHRGRQYEAWLGEGSARMLAAVPAGDEAAAPVGYAVLSVKASMASWDVGEQTGELETLAVAEEARGAGIGTMLIEACRERLREQGVRYWAVAVVEDNADATRLYERVGFRPFYRQLLAEV